MLISHRMFSLQVAKLIGIHPGLRKVLYLPRFVGKYPLYGGIVICICVALPRESERDRSSEGVGTSKF